MRKYLLLTTAAVLMTTANAMADPASDSSGLGITAEVEVYGGIINTQNIDFGRIKIGANTGGNSVIVLGTDGNRTVTSGSATPVDGTGAQAGSFEVSDYTFETNPSNVSFYPTSVDLKDGDGNKMGTVDTFTTLGSGSTVSVGATLQLEEDWSVGMHTAAPAQSGMDDNGVTVIVQY